MKTFIKSFSGAVAGSLLVLVTFYLLLKPEPIQDTDNQMFKFHQTVFDSPVNTGVDQPVNHDKAISTSALPEAQVDFTEAAEKSVNAVVHIKTEMRIKSVYYDDFFGTFRNYFYPQKPNTVVAFGSGVIISPDGYIVTNNHVVAGADRITVTFNDKTEKEARVIGTDPSTDLALIKVEGNRYTWLRYGDSDKLKVGEWVLAVGNPFNLTSTVTAGIVSAKARNINILGTPSAIESYIQTDAVVNRGNSGGALVNAKGELVGINAAIASHTGVYEGYSFAIPVNIVKKVVEDLKNYGEPQRAYLGVQVRDIDEKLADNLGVNGLEGIYVAGVVEGSGADDAGIKAGDIILSIDSHPVNSLPELMGVIGQYRPGDKVVVKIKNADNVEEMIQVTLKNKNNSTILTKAPHTFFNTDLGAWLQNVSEEELNALHIDAGLKVISLNDGILERGGIDKGFIIYNINGMVIDSEKALQRALHSSNRNIVKLKGIYPDGVKISFEFIL